MNQVFIFSVLALAALALSVGSASAQCNAVFAVNGNAVAANPKGITATPGKAGDKVTFTLPGSAFEVNVKLKKTDGTFAQGTTLTSNGKETVEYVIPAGMVQATLQARPTDGAQRSACKVGNLILQVDVK